jgi:hypothetical protein
MRQTANKIHVGIAGYATSGKDEVANVFKNEFAFVGINMSDALDKYLQLLDPIIQVAYEGPTEGGDASWIRLDRYADIRRKMTYTDAKSIKEVRELLQRLGTEVGRDIDPFLWTNLVARSAAMHERVVTTGIRYIEEMSPIDVLIEVRRPGVGPVNSHSSDAGMAQVLAKADYVIHNDGTLDELYVKVRKLIPTILRKFSCD